MRASLGRVTFLMIPLFVILFVNQSMGLGLFKKYIDEKPTANPLDTEKEITSNNGGERRPLQDSQPTQTPARAGKPDSDSPTAAENQQKPLENLEDQVLKELVTPKYEIIDSVDNCVDKDLRSAVGPVRNQQDKGWCFANATSDVLTVLFNNGEPVTSTKDQVSSSFTAINMFIWSNKNAQIASQNLSESQSQKSSAAKSGSLKIDYVDPLTGEGGSIQGALSYAMMASKVCSQRIDDDLLSYNSSRTLSERLNFFRNLWYLNKERLSKKSASQSREESHKRRNDPHYIKLLNELDILFNSGSLLVRQSQDDKQNQKKLQRRYKKSKIQSVSRMKLLLEKINKEALEDSLKLIIEDVCSIDQDSQMDWKSNVNKADIIIHDRFILEKPTLNSYYYQAEFHFEQNDSDLVSKEEVSQRRRLPFNTGGFYPFIDKQFDESDLKVPVAISAPIEKIISEEYKETEISGPHAMTVVARRFNSHKQQCEYFVRNSWGKDCKTYVSAFGGKEVDIYRNDFECDKENGGFWASRKSMNEIINEVVYLTKKQSSR